jgi:hypothetical protein
VQGRSLFSINFDRLSSRFCDQGWSCPRPHNVASGTGASCLLSYTLLRRRVFIMVRRSFLCISPDQWDVLWNRVCCASYWVTGYILTYACVLSYMCEFLTRRLLSRRVYLLRQFMPLESPCTIPLSKNIRAK